MSIETDTRTVFGFWVYLMTDCLLFASLFATYAVLHNNIWDGPSSRAIFDLPFVLTETLILLTSSFTSGLAMLGAHRSSKSRLLFWFVITFLLGSAFVTMELREFSQLAREGYSWTRSGFLSSFFTLVGTHGLHISVGLLWMLVMMGQVARRGFKPIVMRRLICLSLFWHFLDVVWIFIFTLVYLMGVI